MNKFSNMKLVEFHFFFIKLTSFDIMYFVPDCFFTIGNMNNSFLISPKMSTIIVEIPVPVAIIVCEGDLKTIAEISHALKKSLPVIIIKGSGKAADFTVDYLEKYY